MLVDWWYSSSLLRARQKDILDTLTLSRWAESGNRDVFLKNIKDSAYSDLFSETNLEKYETVLENALFGLYRELETLVPDALLLRMHRLTVDLNNVKMTVKSRLQELDMDWEMLSDSGVYPSDDVYTIVFERQYQKMPPEISAGLYRAEEEYQRTRNIQLLDFILDSAFHDYRMQSLRSAPGYGLVLNYYRGEADLENIKNAFRAVRMTLENTALRDVALGGGFLPQRDVLEAAGESMDSLADYVRKTRYGPALEDGVRDVLDNRGFVRFEKAADEYLLSELRPFRYIPSGPEVIEEYIRIKKSEIRNLKIVFIGLLNNLKPDDVRSRIREVH